MAENIKPPIDYEEGSPVEEKPRDNLDEVEQHQIMERIRAEREADKVESRKLKRLHDDIIDGHYEEQARLQAAQDRRQNEKHNTPEAKEPERHIVRSFAEFMMRAQFSGKVRWWDMGTEERINESIKHRYLEPIAQPGSFLDGNISKIKFPYWVGFSFSGPDLNDPTGQKREGFAGDYVNEEMFNIKWAGRLDMGPDHSGHDQGWYETEYALAVAKAKAEEERHNRRYRR